ncbi:deiodinase-like protein [Mariprofundus sp. EBB-1]|uniref:deiodinase-like protein n=1 Tax=Mariprofundus sp. EBB-1 TaxID=2650971 RepID=UPI00137B1794|nr:deiodinase-like protein [Mariprofundus sp. EBB-1]
MKIPAYLVLRLLSATLVMIGLTLLFFSVMYLLSHEVIPPQYRDAMFVLGVLLLLLGFVGPVRILYKGAQIPVEIKRAIMIQAITMPLSGIAFLFAGMMNASVYGVWACFFVGLLILLSALVGIYPLSKKFPDTFYIDEMLSIIKSAGLAGDKKNSSADKAFLRWTQGREGVPVGSKAPDGTVITMQGEAVALSSFFGEKLLVLNFASYSCPHHRKRISEIQTLMKKWQHHDVNFLTIYTAEAHTEDGWKLVDQYLSDVEYTNEKDFCFSYAKNINERKKMAEWLMEKKHFDMQLVLDSMQDSLLKAYNSWPIRLYIIHEDRVVYCGQQGPFGYNPADVDMTLEKLLGACQT